jgi:predicted outer membrane repeat protein
MKKLIVLFLFFPLLVVTSQASEYLSDTIVWSGNIELNADQFFTQQQTLQILPGTVVTATGPYKIEIRGNIVAEGTFENPILFTAMDTVGLYDTATIAGGWHGIHLLDNPNGEAHFKHCTIEYGKANVPGSWHDHQGISDTLSGNQGGAFRITDYKTIEFDHCSFFYNYSRTRGAAVYCNNLNTITITDCNFEHNITMVDGGGVYSNNHDSTIISNSTFRSNTALYSYINAIGFTVFRGDGSAFYLYKHPGNSINIIRNNTIFNNTSQSAVFLAVPSVFFFNNLITNNYNGETVFFSKIESTAFVFNNTIVNNYWWVGIPGIFTVSDDIHMYNNILWDNKSHVIEDDDLVIGWYYNEPNVFNNLIWEGRAPGEAVLTKDPLFTNPAPGYGLDYNGWEYDWSLTDESPAINRGTPDTTGLNLPATDLLGNPRIYGIRVDMGAIENQMVVGLPQNPLVNVRLQVSPNPFGQSFKVVAPGRDKISSISLFNQNGQQIATETMMPFEQMLVFDLSNQSPGLYLLVTRFADGSTETTKLVKY